MTTPARTAQANEIITHMLKEYDRLGNEITQRVASRTTIMQVVGVIAALLAAGGTLSPHYLSLWVALVALVFGCAWIRDVNQGIQRLGKALSDIEADVNSIAAEHYGRPLLRWETRRQAIRRREPRFWRLVGRAGGWHRDG